MVGVLMLGALVLGMLLLAMPAWAGPADKAAAETAPGQAAVHCSINDTRITESSGLAVSGNGTAERLYTVNDGGSQLRVFVLDRSCKVIRAVTANVDPYDVEDLARSADGTLWLADLGDNDKSRRTVAIELLTETGSARLFRFAYPDGAHDAEALLLDRAGKPYIVTKEPLGASGVYTPTGVPAAGATTPLRKVTTVQMSPSGTAGGPVGVVGQLTVTGGAVSADGTRIALRTYTDAYVWRAEDGDVAKALTSGKPTRIALPATQQGEAIAFAPDGHSLLTSTEGRPAAVHQITLGDLASAPTTSAPARAAPAGNGATPTSKPGPGRQIGKVAVALAIAASLVWGGTKVASRRA
jgi:hypothetical protein